MRVRMKLVVPLTIPITRVMCSPARDSRSGRRIGTPPATAASKSRSTPATSAAAYSSAPWLASSSLLPVTTGLPLFSAVRMSSRAGSMPPISSTTTSTSGSSTTDAASSVRTPSGSSTGRSRLRLRTATRVTSRRSPVRRTTSSRRVSTRFTNGAPTLPQPSRPIRTVVSSFTAGTLVASTCWSGVESEQVVLGLATDDDPGGAVPHEHDGRARDLVVVRTHRVAVGTGDRGGEEVAHRQVIGYRCVAHEHVARLAVLADHGDHPPALGERRSGQEGLV